MFKEPFGVRIAKLEEALGIVAEKRHDLLMGDTEARAELGMPEKIAGNLKPQQPTQPEEPGQSEQRQFETPGEPKNALGKLPVKLIKAGNGASYLVRALS